MLGERGNAPRRTDTFALFFLSLLYFAVGCLSHLEPIDEGQLVYPSWRVAEGAIPFRDFMHLYGPSPFFLNGALFRWFGHDLLVLRLSLAVLKAGAAVVVFLSASHLMSRSFAWLVSGLFVAVWGFPWAFNSPYPNHYAMTAVLAGMLVFLCLPRRFLLGCFLAGLSFGLAATFKQTTGAFAAVWFALFLLVERPPVPPEEGHWNVGGGAAALASRLVRWAVVAGAFARDLEIFKYPMKLNY